MYQVETSHWWYCGMESLTRQLLTPLERAGNLKILDAGCGTGGALSGYLAEYGTATGCDLSTLALAFCQKRNLSKIAQASATSLPFSSAHFDLVTSFDVLYERGVASDWLAVSEFGRVLRPGGYLLLRLPAYNWLRGKHDERIQTARRYTAAQVKTMLAENQFKIIKLTYANSLLFPLAVAKRLLERLQPPGKDQSDLQASPVWLNPILTKILASEAHLIARTNLPLGLSVLALAQKPR